MQEARFGYIELMKKRPLEAKARMCKRVHILHNKRGKRTPMKNFVELYHNSLTGNLQKAWPWMVLCGSQGWGSSTISKHSSTHSCILGTSLVFFIFSCQFSAFTFAYLALLSIFLLHFECGISCQCSWCRFSWSDLSAGFGCLYSSISSPLKCLGTSLVVNIFYFLSLSPVSWPLSGLMFSPKMCQPKFHFFRRVFVTLSEKTVRLQGQVCLYLAIPKPNFSAISARLSFDKLKL